MATSHSYEKRWKYLSFALIGILAAGGTLASMPQASGHITNQTQHMLEDIYNMVNSIKSRVDNIKNDVSNVKTDVSAIKTKVDTNLDATVSSRASQTSVDALQSTATGIDSKVTDIQNKITTSGSEGMKGINLLKTVNPSPGEQVIIELLPTDLEMIYVGHINVHTTGNFVARLTIDCGF
jgi:hypothetical protein